MRCSLPASQHLYLRFLCLVVMVSLSSFLVYMLWERDLQHSSAGLDSLKQLPLDSVNQPLNRYVALKQLLGPLPNKTSLLIQKHNQTAILENDNTKDEFAGSPKKHFGKLGAVLSVQRIDQIPKLATQPIKPLSKTMDKLAERIQQGEKEPVDKPAVSSLVNESTLNYNVQVFYYPWYGTPQTDGRYLHWNHPYLPHWQPREARKWPQGVHAPPDDIGANFYPALGPYSSANSTVADTHMAQVSATGAGVVVVSWYPPGQGDDNGQPFDNLIPLILDAAHKYRVKVALHIEPYQNRSGATFKHHVALHIEPYQNRSGATLKHHVTYIMDTYGKHPALYRRDVGQGRQLPVFYIYDSYQIEASSWAQALKPGGKDSLRGSPYDGVFLGLYVVQKDQPKLLSAGFDGFYTYFAANGFSHGSSWSNWKTLAAFAKKNSLLFVPSVGPGYVDTRVRPWNVKTSRKRLKGKYFRESLQAALDAGVDVVSVTSFNEWHEGSQIEPAVPKVIKGFTYEDYLPGGPDFYLLLLKEYVDKFSKQHT